MNKDPKPNAADSDKNLQKREGNEGYYNTNTTFGTGSMDNTSTGSSHTARK